MLESLASTHTLSVICDIEKERHFYVPAFVKLVRSCYLTLFPLIYYWFNWLPCLQLSQLGVNQFSFFLVCAVTTLDRVYTFKVLLSKSWKNMAYSKPQMSLKTRLAVSGHFGLRCWLSLAFRLCHKPWLGWSIIASYSNTTMICKFLQVHGLNITVLLNHSESVLLKEITVIDAP